jgi:hypothetical protein
LEAFSVSDPNASGNWPKDFVEALIRADWRSWVDAVKSENDSWETFEACFEIPYTMDFQGQGQAITGETEALAIMDSFTKTVAVIALPNREAVTLAPRLLDEISANLFCALISALIKKCY